jgi:hypothetical protein
MALILLQVGATPIAIGIVTKMFEPTVLKKRSDYFNPKKSDTFTIRHRAINIYRVNTLPAKNPIISSLEEALIGIVCLFNNTTSFAVMVTT